MLYTFGTKLTCSKCTTATTSAFNYVKMNTKHRKKSTSYLCNIAQWIINSRTWTNTPK